MTQDKVEALNGVNSPIFEPGLDELLAKNRGRYHATRDFERGRETFEDFDLALFNTHLFLLSLP
ncbi:MAG: hypothetical protein ACP5E9_03255, partial [Candidatus Methanospirareceae archaeon]